MLSLQSSNDQITLKLQDFQKLASVWIDAKFVFGHLFDMLVNIGDRTS